MSQKELYKAKNEAFYQVLRSAEEEQSAEYPAWHGCIVAEQLQSLTKFRFRDGIIVPNAWKLSFNIIQFAFYHIKYDPEDELAPLFVEFYFHDERLDHKKCLQLKSATRYSTKVYRDTKHLPYLAPQYLTWIKANGKKTTVNGFPGYLLCSKQMVLMGDSVTGVSTRLNHLQARPLTGFKASRLSALLRSYDKNGDWNIVVMDEALGTSMSWGGTKHFPPLFEKKLFPLDATALWGVINAAGFIEPHRQPRGWVELDMAERQQLINRLDRLRYVSMAINAIKEISISQ